MIKNDWFEALIQYRMVSSWAIWNPDDYRAIPDFKSQLGKLLNDVVIVGLNVSDDITIAWQNFHSGPNDRKLMKAFSGTSYEGAYMTDLIKNKPETSSNELIKNLTDDELSHNFEILYKEMKTLGATKNTLFILFGNDVKELFLKEPIFYYNNILCCPHFAYFGMSDKQWIAKVHSTIRKHQKKTESIFDYTIFRS